MRLGRRWRILIRTVRITVARHRGRCTGRLRGWVLRIVILYVPMRWTLCSVCRIIRVVRWIVKCGVRKG